MSTSTGAGGVPLGDEQLNTILTESLLEMGLDPVAVDSETKEEIRAELVREFQTEPNMKAVVADEMPEGLIESKGGDSADTAALELHLDELIDDLNSPRTPAKPTESELNLDELMEELNSPPTSHKALENKPRGSDAGQTEIPGPPLLEVEEREMDWHELPDDSGTFLAVLPTARPHMSLDQLIARSSPPEVSARSKDSSKTGAPHPLSLKVGQTDIPLPRKVEPPNASALVTKKITSKNSTVDKGSSPGSHQPGNTASQWDKGGSHARIWVVATVIAFAGIALLVWGLTHENEIQETGAVSTVGTDTTNQIYREPPMNSPQKEEPGFQYGSEIGAAGEQVAMISDRSLWKITASKEADIGPATNAIDGDVETSWTAGDGKFNHWIMLDLGQLQKVHGMRVRWFSRQNYEYDVLSSLDGENWVSVSQSVGTESIYYHYFLTTSRYLKIDCRRSKTPWISLRELELLGEPGMRRSAKKGSPKDDDRSGRNLAAPGDELRISGTFSSSSAQVNHPVQLAFDGDEKTRWIASSGEFPQWVAISMDTKAFIHGLEVIMGQDAEYHFSIASSLQGAIWRNRGSSQMRGDRHIFHFYGGVRYLKMTITKGPKDGISIREFRKLPPTVTPLGTLLVSSSRFGHPVQNAFDGDDNTYWCAAYKDRPEWIIVDFGKEEEVRGVNIRRRETNGFYRYRVRVSPDCLDWRDVGKSRDGELVLEHLFDVKTRYLQIRCSAVTKGEPFSICEMDILKK